MIYELTTTKRKVTVSAPDYGTAVDWVLRQFPGEPIMGVVAIPEVSAGSNGDDDDDDE